MSRPSLFKLPLLIAAATVPLAAGLPAPVAAQNFPIGYQFLEAVKKQEGTTATKLLEDNAGPLINTRDITTGKTGLHYVLEDSRRSTNWVGFLLQKGANANIADKKGETPLLKAVRLNWPEAIDWLLRYKADVNAGNRSGETPLIVAVQLRNEQVVRQIMRAGANPDKQDRMVGMSARDYASRDARDSDILSIIEAEEKNRKTAPTTKAAGPDLDFSGAPLK